MGSLETPSPGPEFLVSVKVATATKTILDYKKNNESSLLTTNDSNVMSLSASVERRDMIRSLTLMFIFSEDIVDISIKCSLIG